MSESVSSNQNISGSVSGNQPSFTFYDQDVQYNDRLVLRTLAHLTNDNASISSDRSSRRVRFDFREQPPHLRDDAISTYSEGYYSQELYGLRRKNLEPARRVLSDSKLHKMKSMFYFLIMIYFLLTFTVKAKNKNKSKFFETFS